MQAEGAARADEVSWTKGRSPDFRPPRKCGSAGEVMHPAKGAFASGQGGECGFACVAVHCPTRSAKARFSAELKTRLAGGGGLAALGGA